MAVSETTPASRDGGDAIIPTAPWTAAIASARNPSRRLPQTIAHRGYKAAWPENTMGAFRGAAQIGAHAVETDLHITADGVVVLSHDATLRRCFGVDKKIADCTWEYVSSLQTLMEPRQSMPRLVDLLEWMAEPGMEKFWALLDIKLDDNVGTLVSGIAQAFALVASSVPWRERIVLGCWNATFIKTCHRLLPDFPVILISFFVPFARRFLPTPNLGFNLVQRLLVMPFGLSFAKRLQREGRPLFLWTVNDARWMEWCLNKNERLKPAASSSSNSDESPAPVTDSGYSSGRDQLHPWPADGSAAVAPASRRKDEAGTAVPAHRPKMLVDGVITDNPKLFLEVCERWEDEQDGKRPRQSAGVVGGARNLLWAMSELAKAYLISSVLFVHRRFVLKWLDEFEEPRLLR